MMEKSELLVVLQEENQQWEALLDEIGSPNMEKAGVNGAWSFKDLVAHLAGWHKWLVMRMQAASRGESQPLPPWPANLEKDDDINAWLFDTNHERPLREVVEDSRQVFAQLLAVIASLPEDVRIDKVEPRYYLVWIGGQRFEAGEFFDHFIDDHEPDVRAWMELYGRGKHE
jgi:hypothetical protein